ncbi:hypothetical protein [Cyclobacterium amurskyense]|uniref:hypothetical protein n=1 Tax=Cyclobacterium amurskyense TaxID=320787 RepID=UPI0030D81E65|tara:strand:+ start:2724 stop:5396 length:2673 start_codon:yes stop_codon:yes gene_type:complete
MKNYLLILFLGTSLVSYSQNDYIPFSTKQYLNNDITINSEFTPLSKSYDKNKARIDNQKIINKLYNSVEDAENLQTYNKRSKIVIEGVADVINKIPGASTMVAVTKESIYQAADSYFENNTVNVKIKFNESIKSAFNSSVANELKNNPDITYEESVDMFAERLSSFSESLNLDNYKILAPIADQQSLQFIKDNRLFFLNKFNAQKADIANIISKTKAELSADFDSKMSNYMKSINDVDEQLLQGIKGNADGLSKFNEKVESKFNKLDEDIKEMRSDIKSNEVEIASNKTRINQNQSDIVLVAQLQAKNAGLISENSYKTGVITDVLYNNVNISGKIKILDLKFKDDKNNPKYIECKNTLENINSVQEIKSYLSDAGDIVELATNLGLSKEDAKNANQAIAIGNVIANGAMAYFSGNPMAALQAANGTFAFFGGGEQPDLQFDAIMAEFNKINKKLEEMNKKLDVINDNILDLTKLNIDLYVENQKRFTKIDEKLITIVNKLDRITQLIYSDDSSLKILNASQYILTWKRVKNAKSLNELKYLYASSQELKDMVKIVYINTKSKTLSDKKFIHFNNFEVSNNWEDKIYNPMYNLVKELYPNINLNNLEYSLINLFDYTTIPKLDIKYNDNNIFKKDITKEMDILIHPQSILTLTEFTSLVEPYLYFYNANENYNFNIPKPFTVDTSLKNANTKIKFENILIENRKSIAQTNIISGAILLPYFKKHILEKDFDPQYKKMVYELLNSKNEYLKLNLSNYILNTELTLGSQIEKFYDIQEQTDLDKAINIVNEINKDFNFENNFFKLGIEGLENNFRIVVTINPSNIEGLDISKNVVNLPLPPFEYLLEKKVVYPEYLQGLLENENVLINKVVKYDMIEKIRGSKEFKNYINLN